MKLLISVVNSDDAHSLIDALTREEYRTTLISTMGGFLRKGNATLLIGVADEKVNDVLGIIRDNCHARVAYLNAFPPAQGPEGAYVSMPIEVRVGGAIVFALNVERFVKF